MGPPDSGSGGEAPASNKGGTRENESSEFANAAPQTAAAGMIDTLGEALAGVNLGQKASGGEGFGASAVSTANFALENEGNGWDHYAATDNGQSGFTSSAGSITPARGSHSNEQGANGKDSNSHLRNESIELFLSQSPSQTLGDDLYKLSHPNLPALVSDQESGGSSGDHASTFRLSSQPTLTSVSSSSPAQGRPPQERQRTRTLTASPSTYSIGTGTSASSRSVSPYGNNSDVGSGARRTIQAYQPYDSSSVSENNTIARNQSSFAENDPSNSAYYLNHGHGSNTNLATHDAGHRSPHSKDRKQIKSNGPGSSFEQQGYDRPQQGLPTNPADHQGQQHVAAPIVNQQQSQVLYMAMPSPDGRGQVLQPVQMVQLPGKPYATYVVPGSGGNAGIPGATSAVQTGSMSDPQQGGPMMVLPPMGGNQQMPDYNAGTSAAIANDTRNPIDVRSRVPSYAVSNANDLSSAGAQYQPDSAVSSLYSAPQRPPLDELLGQVRRLSRDQVGCRLVQQALDEEGPMAATAILNEGLPFWGEAMVDPFGNYLFQKILEKVTAEERIMLVRSVSSRLVNASLNLHGTRSVQKVVELCAIDERNKSQADDEETAADILTKSLAPAAARLCIDSHGNHVIQRILLKLGHKHAKFVFDAVAASVGDVARHRHGCCVIQRCLDSPPTNARSHLVYRIVDKSLELMQDAYGNYVVQYVLDVCSDEDVHAVCESVTGKVNLLAIQKFSSNVMEKCLERCSDRVKEMYLAEMSDPERIRELMMDPFGNYVVQRALSVATHTQAVRLVEAMRPHLVATQSGGPNGHRNGGVRNTAGGRRIIAKICRRFPNFTLSSVGSQDELYSQNKGNQRNPVAPPVLATYAPISGHGQHGQQQHMGVHGQQQHFAGGDPRMSHQTQSHIPVQQHQSYYSVGGGNPYYGGYPGM